MHNHLQRIMRLVRRTGDRVIVTDSRHPEESFVLMGFDDYELLIDERFGDADDYGWQPEAGIEEMADDEGGIDTTRWEPAETQEDEAEPAAAIEDEGSFHGDIPPEAFQPEADEEDLDNAAGYGTMGTVTEKIAQTRKQWQIPPEIKRGSEAVEEDRYYLESV